MDFEGAVSRSPSQATPCSDRPRLEDSLAIRTPWLALLAGSLVGTAHCSQSPSTPTDSPTVESPIVVNTARVCLNMTPEGGSLSHPSGATLVVPSGALERTTELCLKGAAAPAGSVLHATVLGAAIAATPEGQTFRKPVTLRLPFDATRVPAGTDVNASQIRMAPSGSNAFSPIQTAVDLANGLLVAKTVHFTDFVPALDPNPVFITAPDTNLATGTVGTAYSQAFAVTGGTSPYSWQVAPSSAAPPGLTFDPTGHLLGIPSLPNTFAFFVEVTDSANHAVQAPFFLTVVSPTNPQPGLLSVTPNTIAEGSGTTTISLAGSSFEPTSTVLFDGLPIASTYVNFGALAAAIPAAALATAGSHLISVSNPGPGGGVSASLPFQVLAVAKNPIPTITTASVTEVAVSTVDTEITLIGTNFISATSATLGGQGIPTQVVSGDTLHATIPASYLSSPVTLQLGVYNPPPGGGFGPSTYAVQVGVPNPVPSLASIFPSSVAAGSGAFTLSVTGTSFVQGGQLFFGSTALATTVSSATSAHADVPASLSTQIGSSPIIFVNPTPGGGASAALALLVVASSDAGAPSDGGDGGSDGSDGASPPVNTCISPASNLMVTTPTQMTVCQTDLLLSCHPFGHVNVTSCSNGSVDWKSNGGCETSLLQPGYYYQDIGPDPSPYAPQYCNNWNPSVVFESPWPAPSSSPMTIASGQTIVDRIVEASLGERRYSIATTGSEPTFITAQIGVPEPVDFGLSIDGNFSCGGSAMGPARACSGALSVSEGVHTVEVSVGAGGKFTLNVGISQ